MWHLIISLDILGGRLCLDSIGHCGEDPGKALSKSRTVCQSVFSRVLAAIYIKGQRWGYPRKPREMRYDVWIQHNCGPGNHGNQLSPQKTKKIAVPRQSSDLGPLVMTGESVEVEAGRIPHTRCIDSPFGMLASPPRRVPLGFEPGL